MKTTKLTIHQNKLNYGTYIYKTYFPFLTFWNDKKYEKAILFLNIFFLFQAKNIVQAEIDAVCELIDFLRFNVQYALVRSHTWKYVYREIVTYY